MSEQTSDVNVILGTACKYSSRMTASQLATLKQASTDLESLQAGNNNDVSLSDIQSSLSSLSEDMITSIAKGVASQTELSTLVSSSLQTLKDNLESTEVDIDDGDVDSAVQVQEG